MPIQVNITLGLRAFFAFTGVFIFVTGLIHLCKFGWGNWSVKGIKSNSTAVCGFIAVMLLIEGLYVIISPWVFLIPSIKNHGNFWSINASIIWMVITAIIILFFVGWVGLITSIMCWICAILNIMVSLIGCVTKEERNDKNKDPYNP
ncbi:hypothetical protein QTN25_003987 [Entamoeba marina]